MSTNQIENNIAQSRIDAQPLVDDLQSIGIPIVFIDELSDKIMSSNPSAYSVLVRHLTRNYPENIRQFIVVRLGNKKAVTIWSSLLKIYREDNNPSLKDAIAFTLSTIANAKLLPQLVELLKDPSNGRSRILFVRKIFKSQRYRNVVIALKDDPDLKIEIGSIVKTK